MRLCCSVAAEAEAEAEAETEVRERARAPVKIALNQRPLSPASDRYYCELTRLGVYRP